MNDYANVLGPLWVRARLIRRFSYRIWRLYIFSKAKSLLDGVIHEVPDTLSLKIPAIILSTYQTPKDLLLLAHLFKDKELTFIAPPNLPNEKVFSWLRSTNHIIHLQNRVGYAFFKQVLTTLRDYNRSIVIPASAVNQYISDLSLDPSTIARLTMLANVPIIPVIMKWQRRERGHRPALNKCKVWIRKKIYVSPRSEEFRDIFFKHRGARKFSKLPKEDLFEIGRRIIATISVMKGANGSDLSEKMGA